MTGAGRLLRAGRTAGLLGAAAWLVAALPALAQEPPPAVDYDDRIIDACLTEHWGGQNAQEACIGIAARACMPPGEGDAPLAVGCFDAERAQWEDRMTGTLDALRMQLGPAPADPGAPDAAAPDAAAEASDDSAPAGAETGILAALDAMQSAWEAWRDAACGFDGAVYPDSPVGDVARAECLMRLTGRQVFHLMARLDGDI